MTRRYLRKYPKVPGAARLQPSYVAVEVVRAEDRVTTVPVFEFVDDPERTAAMGFPCQKRVQVGTRENREAGFVVREKGRTKWVPAWHLTDKIGG